MTDDLIEIVARALCDLDLWQCGGSDGTRLNPEMPNWHHYRQDARAALAAIEASGTHKDRPRRWLDWARRTFGDIALDPRERTLRFLEEALELAHAMGLEESVAAATASRVYGRDRGNISREIGQALACLECLAEAIEVDADREASRELERVQTIPQDEWARRHGAKVALGIALAARPRDAERG